MSYSRKAFSEDRWKSQGGGSAPAVEPPLIGTDMIVKEIASRLDNLIFGYDSWSISVWASGGWTLRFTVSGANILAVEGQGSVHHGLLVANLPIADPEVFDKIVALAEAFEKKHR